MNWFCEKGIKQGIFWSTLIYLTSSINDVLMKLLGERLSFIEISFFRFLFSIIVVLIPMIISRENLFKTQMHSTHIARGILGAIALGLCCYSVNIIPLAENTTILFSESLFLLPLSAIFLKEKVSNRAILATIIGFIGLLIMFKPKASNINILAIVPTTAAFLFAVMDIMIKKMINNKENTLTMLFYFGLYTTIIAGIVVPRVWITPTSYELILIFLLGIGANLIQLFIFLAYRATNASNMASTRYLELLFSISFGFVFFNQIPKLWDIAGALFIILGTFILSRDNK
ncbi:MAG: DMT family transporter [Alphaproteobacteria bacterium]|nr:DMT family transporter [Alphaproteobacteria bacterium]